MYLVVYFVRGEEQDRMEVLCLTQSLERAKEVYQKFELSREYKGKTIYNVPQDVELNMETFYNISDIVASEEYKRPEPTVYTVSCGFDINSPYVTVFTSQDYNEALSLYNKLNTCNKRLTPNK
jgi:hypothetical protein